MKRKLIHREPASMVGVPEHFEPVVFPTPDNMKLNTLCNMACSNRVWKSRARRPAVETVIDVFLEKPE